MAAYRVHWPGAAQTAAAAVDPAYLASTQVGKQRPDHAASREGILEADPCLDYGAVAVAAGEGACQSREDACLVGNPAVGVRVESFLGVESPCQGSREVDGVARHLWWD